MIVAHALTHTIAERTVLRNVSLSLRAGELVAVLGPNGAGKSSLLRCMAGVWKPTEGTVCLDARSLAAWDPLDLARRRATLWQHNDAPAGMAALDLVGLARFCHGDERSAHGRSRALRALERVGALNLAQREVTSLSGGERQRVHLARTLAQLDDGTTRSHGRVLLLDEPATHLDIAWQVHMLGVARAFAREGAAVLAVLHELSLATRFADRVLVLREGVAVAEGSPRNVLSAPLLAHVWRIPFEVIEVAGAPTPIATPSLDVPLPQTNGTTS